MADAVSVPTASEDIASVSMATAVDARHQGVEFSEVRFLLHDNRTNRRAPCALTYLPSERSPDAS
jgi:hypothetical protein